MSGNAKGRGTPPPGSTFDADWLSLREPVDHRSRAEELLGPLERAWGMQGWRRIADLGAGAGSNVRYLAGRLPGPQEWILVDHDAALLSRAEPPGSGVTVTRIVGDLGAEGMDVLGDVDLVVGSALLDLTSEAWLRRVAEACRSHGLGALFSTIYDGTVHWKTAAGGETAPETLERDRRVLELVNAHQRRDKGLGGALGPDAAHVAHRLFRDAGLDTWLVPGPWVLDAGDARLAGMLIDGWAEAALEQSEQVAPWMDEWREVRKADVASGRTQLTVGHLDLLALPPAA